MQPVSRIPNIRSEIAIAIAYLGWSLRQLADYSVLAGYPVSERFLESALAMPWVDYQAKADPRLLDHLAVLLGGLGIGLQEDVFGIVRKKETRLPPTGQGTQAPMLLALAANYPKGDLRLVIQEPAPGKKTPTPAFLLGAGERYLLCDHPLADAAELVDGLYAKHLNRLRVAEQRLSALSRLGAQEAVAALLRANFRPALNVSKTRVHALLRAEDAA